MGKREVKWEVKREGGRGVKRRGKRHGNSGVKVVERKDRRNSRRE